MGPRQRSSSLRPHSADKNHQTDPYSNFEDRAGSARIRFGSACGVDRKCSLPLGSPHIRKVLSGGKGGTGLIPRSREQRHITLHEIPQEEHSKLEHISREEEEEVCVRPFRGGESMVPRKELFGACSQGYVRSVEFLLDNFDFPGGINVRDTTGCTPFLRAA